MTILKQPTSHSCGQTCLAMILGFTSVDAVILRMKAMRKRGKRNDATTQGEMMALFRSYGYRMGRKLRDPLPAVGTALVRIKHLRGRNGHYVVLQDGVIYDPDHGGVRDISYVHPRRITWHEIEKKEN